MGGRAESYAATALRRLWGSQETGGEVGAREEGRGVVPGQSTTPSLLLLAELGTQDTGREGEQRPASQEGKMVRAEKAKARLEVCRAGRRWGVRVAAYQRGASVQKIGTYPLEGPAGGR